MVTEQEKKELVTKYEKIIPFISVNSKILNETQFSYEVLDTILFLQSNKAIYSLFASMTYYNKKIINGIIKCATNEKTKQCLIKLAPRLKEETNEYDSNGETFMDYVNNDEFIDYILALEDKTMQRKINIYDLYKDMERNTKITNWRDNIYIFNKIVRDPNSYKYNIKDVNDYEVLREQYYIDCINHKKDEKENISLSYFNMKMSTLEEYVYKIEGICRIKNIIPDKEIYNCIKLLPLLNGETLINYIKIIKDYTDYFENLDEKIKDISINDLLNKVNIYNGNGKKIIEFNGQPFHMLVHCIKGYSNKYLARELEQDISKWDRCYEENSFISCSLINNEILGVSDDNNIILGFNNITKEQVLAFSNKDMYFEKRDIIAASYDYAANYMLTDQLLLNSTLGYNEIALKRYDHDKALLPNYVVALDEINDKTKKVSDYFNIPIYLIHTHSYIELLINKLQLLKESDTELFNKYIKVIYGALPVETNYFFNIYKKLLEEEIIPRSKSDRWMVLTKK